MRIMGLDVGEKTIGVAISDEFGWTAQGIGVIDRKKLENDLKILMGFVKDYNVQEVIVGLPKNMNGTLGYRAVNIMQLTEILKEELGIPVKLWDERLTTVMAEKALIEADVSRKKRKKVIDKMAAILILQGYLDNKR